jgi:hypothetical protein
VAVIDEFEFTVNPAAGTPPNVTPVAPPKLLPLIATDVPPPDDPLPVPRLLTAGGDAALYAN